MIFWERWEHFIPLSVIDAISDFWHLIADYLILNLVSSVTRGWNNIEILRSDGWIINFGFDKQKHAN